MRALITGATGFVGRTLLQQIAQPVILSRDPQRARAQYPNAEAHFWDPVVGLPPADAFSGVEAIFHLAGEPVGEGRWNARKKQLIRDSRVIGTKHLVEALAGLTERPRVLVAASAIGFYGDRGNEELKESSRPGADFLAEVCKEWEIAAARAENHGVRHVSARFGIVLGHGGALAKMLLPFKLGIGGRLGDGRQWMSWVHVADVVGMMLHAAAHEDVHGPMNTVSPQPVTNSEFTRALATALHRPAIFPMPGFALRLAVGEFAEVLLASQRVLPEVALRSGYSFAYPRLPGALEEAVQKGAPRPSPQAA